MSPTSSPRSAPGIYDVELAVGHLAQRAVQPRHRPGDAREPEQHRAEDGQHHHDRQREIDAVGVRELGGGHLFAVGHRLARDPDRRRDQVGALGRGRKPTALDQRGDVFLELDEFIGRGDERLRGRAQRVDGTPHRRVVREQTSAREEFTDLAGLGGDDGFQSRVAGRRKAPAGRGNRVEVAVGFLKLAFDGETIGILFERLRIQQSSELRVPVLALPVALAERPELRGRQFGDLVDDEAVVTGEQLGSFEPRLVFFVGRQADR